MAAPIKSKTESPTPLKRDKFSQRDKAKPVVKLQKPPKEKKPKGRPPSKPYLVTVTLSTVHTINGEPFGPGPVQVSPEVGGVLMDNETKLKQQEAQFWGTRTRIFYHDKRPAITVPPELFDRYLNATHGTL